MIKKLLLAVALVAVVVACGDKKKENKDDKAPKYACVETFVQNPDSLLNLAEATIQGKIVGACPASNALILGGPKGAKIRVIAGEGVNTENLQGKKVAVTGKITAQVLDSIAIADMQAKMAEHKEACKKEGEGCCKDGEKKEGCCKDGKKEECCKGGDKKEGCCKDGDKKECGEKKEGCCKDGKKDCCKAPQVGDKVYSIVASKIEEIKCSEEKCCGKDKKEEGCCKDGDKKECEKSCCDKDKK